MRIAIVSDVHGNLTALEAVIEDLRRTTPDIVLHGGDLADGGTAPVDVVDRIRALGWAGVAGNGDQMLCDPKTLSEFADGSAAPGSLFVAVEAMAAWARERLGEGRLRWLASMPFQYKLDSLALVHARPGDPWRAPGPEARDAELEAIYAPLASPVAVYGHIHKGFVRRTDNLTVANAGSVGLPYDGDARASYLLVEDGVAMLQRVAYDVDREVAALAVCGLPHADWTARMIRSGRPQLP